EFFNYKPTWGNPCLDKAVNGLPRDSLSIDVLQPSLSYHNALITTLTFQFSIEPNLVAFPQKRKM
ncbi:hypothetical protein J6590_107874, partial [Homalodisca vitripennis]